MRNEQISAVLNEIGDLLEIKGENRFRVNAYRDAARQIDNLGEPLTVLAQEERLRSIPSVGEAIAAKIQELVETGQLAYFERLKKELPISLLELLQIPGLGPRKVKLLYEQLQVASLADLRQALAADRVSSLPGMGGKTVTNLRREIERLELRGRRVPLGLALPLVEEIVAALRALGPVVERVDSAGSVRRRRDTIGDLDVLAASKTPSAVLDAFVGLPVVQEVIGRGDTKASILTQRQLQVDLRVVAPDEWGSALLYFTGSKAHNVQIREIAVRKGWRLNEYGLFDERDGRRLAGGTEDEIYHQLGMTWIPPEIREDSGEIEAALANRLPRLVEIGDIRGELHSHSTWSDGTASIEAMWQAAKERKYEFLALTDHSHSLGVTGG
ncbi:MAG TPA: helix-hairpin-helix domain-containing protein, partial [Chloroflexota bacterium]|nr:helix-hairpin-helix domain-containing protein [Chloroflexota bacterium]